MGREPVIGIPSAPLLQFLTPAFCPDFPRWWTVIGTCEPLLPKLVFVKVPYHSNRKQTQTASKFGGSWMILEWFGLVWNARLQVCFLLNRLISVNSKCCVSSEITDVMFTPHPLDMLCSESV